MMMIDQAIQDLTEVETRVLGCLVEKEATTPEVYPMTTNALVSASNQKTSRDPVVAFSAIDVDNALLSLRERGLVRMVKMQGSRSTKHRHVIDEKLELSRPQLTVIAVLFLRSAQTPGELRTRTERIHEFATPADVEQVLESLAAKGLVQQFERQPGQKENRWWVVDGIATSSFDPTAAPSVAPARAASAGPRALGGGAAAAEVAELRAELADLKRRFEALCDALGEHPE